VWLALPLPFQLLIFRPSTHAISLCLSLHLNTCQSHMLPSFRPTSCQLVPAHLLPLSVPACVTSRPKPRPSPLAPRPLPLVRLTHLSFSSPLSLAYCKKSEILSINIVTPSTLHTTSPQPCSLSQHALLCSFPFSFPTSRLCARLCAAPVT
jgi:hypothetical protein